MKIAKLFQPSILIVIVCAVLVSCGAPGNGVPDNGSSGNGAPGNGVPANGVPANTPPVGTLMQWVDGSTLIFHGGAWVYRSEVTNYQYSLCVEAGNCLLPAIDASSSADNDPEQANSAAQIIGPEAKGEYCAWAGGRLPNEEEIADIDAQTAGSESLTGILIGLLPQPTEEGVVCIVDAPAPMAAACQTSAFYVNGPPAPMDHSVTEAGNFCQNGEGYVTLDIDMPEGGTIQSVNGDCEVVSDNRVLCSAESGSNGEGEAVILDSDSLSGTGEMQCLPGYEPNPESPAQCEFNKLLPAVQKDSGLEVAQLQSSLDQLAGQVSLVVYQPNARRQECGPGQYRNRDTDVCEDIPTCPHGMVFDGVAGCVIPSPTPQGGFPCPPGTHFDERTLACVPICPSGFSWDPVRMMCYAYAPPPGCPAGTVVDPYTGLCVAPSELLHRCLVGFKYNDGEQCCQTELPSGNYPGCPNGQPFDSASGRCDSDNIYLAGGKVLHTVEFDFDAPACEKKDNGGGEGDGGACPAGQSLSCPDKNKPDNCSCQ